MAKFLNLPKKLKNLIYTGVSVGLIGCASIQQPTGGPKDREAPKVLRETPKSLTKNFSSKTIEIELDEFFKLSNQFKEISISPSMEKDPLFKVKKKVLEITFQDTLEKNTTYTINFGKGIVDYNEGNVLKNYSYVFATGNVIDSLGITGTVTNSVTNKPEIEATVFILPVKQDSLFRKKRASLFTSTDSSGNFSLHNLRADNYKIYALKEEGGDRIYNSTNEDIAFQKNPVLLTKDTSGIKLRTFKEEVKVLRVLERKILSDGHVIITFNKAVLKPALQILSPQQLNSVKNTEFNNKGDTALMWLPEMTFDSLSVAIQSDGINIDTVMIRRNAKETYNKTITVSDNVPSSKIRQGRELELILSAPVTNADLSKIILLEDSVSRNFKFLKDTVSLRKYRIGYPWRDKKQYIVLVEENAFTSLSAGKNKRYSKPFTLDPDENYGTLILTVAVPDTTKTYIVELLRGQDEVVNSTIIKAGRTITYTSYPPNKYRVRVVYDTNNNGKWDTGNVKEQLQPENIWIYDSEIILRTNFEVPQSITIPAPPI